MVRKKQFIEENLSKLETERWLNRDDMILTPEQLDIFQKEIEKLRKLSKKKHKKKNISKKKSKKKL